MVPDHERICHPKPGFPRPRGDGPGTSSFQQNSYKVPPPTRGWSLDGLCFAGIGAGSPAHAGMVPVYTPGSTVTFRVPRPRGDGPLTAPRGTRAGLVPPPTRGWSHAALPGDVERRGSPAHAGMVPLGSHCPDERRWFPRPRGDGPRDRNPHAPGSEVPPPTRGWSHSAGNSPHVVAGSPAHAGMVPNVSTNGKLTRRFPRPRGDGPRNQVRGLPAVWVPPPTRGWSPKAST